MPINRSQLREVDFSDVASLADAPDSPVSPGEILRDDFMEPLGLTSAALARALHVPTNRITAIIHGQRGLSADTALRLARYFGTAPEFWVRLQAEYELRVARQAVANDIEREVKPRVA